MFGKKCPKCGSKLKKEKKVWHADKSEFEDEWTCKKCGDLPSHNKSPNKKAKPEKIQKTESKPVLLNPRVEEENQQNRQYFLTSGPPLDLSTIQSKDKYVSEAVKPKKVCSYENCNANITGLDSFNCKYCQQKFCIKHRQAENHNCIKTRHTKYIRKTWLRKRGQNITSGQYIVVCDTCGYVSNLSSLIEYAGEELEYHVKTQGCTEKAIFLEEDLSHEEVPRDVKSHLVLEDRPFWVCAHCRPPRKFTNRDDYIAHHFIHN